MTSQKHCQYYLERRKTAKEKRNPGKYTREEKKRVIQNTTKSWKDDWPAAAAMRWRESPERGIKLPSDTHDIHTYIQHQKGGATALGKHHLLRSTKKRVEIEMQSERASKASDKAPASAPHSLDGNILFFLNKSSTTSSSSYWSRKGKKREGYYYSWSSRAGCCSTPAFFCFKSS